MKVYYDIHIHTILSSCGDELSTPNNILNMCMLKGLNMIAITDHNTLKHLPTFSKLESSFDFLLLYGVEITVKEGFHVLAYFKYLDEALKFDKILEDSIDKNEINNNEFGRQVICDEFDLEIANIDYKINQKIKYNCSEIVKILREFDTIIILAHINRPKNGVLDYYPDLNQLDFDAVEIYPTDNINKLVDKYPILSKYKQLYNSDAHSLESINEAINYIELDSLSFDEFKKWLKRV